MNAPTANAYKSAKVGLLEVFWRWQGSPGAPQLEGYIGQEDDGESFSLNPATQQKGFLLKVPSGTQSMALRLHQEAPDQWQFSARYVCAASFIQSGWGPLLSLPSDEVIPGRHGPLQLPAPWQGKWSLAQRGQASTMLELEVYAPGLRLETASLGGSTTQWATNLPPPFGHFECAYLLEIDRDGGYLCSANLPELPANFTTQTLDDWPNGTPVPPPPPPPENKQPAQQNQVDGLAPFRQLGFLTLLVPPSAGSPPPTTLLRLFPLANDSSYYQQLLSTAAQDSLAALQQLANAFLAGQEPWDGQYVAALNALPPPFANLASPAADALLSEPLADRDTLLSALTRLFGMPPAQLLALPAFATQWARLANSYLTLLLLDYSQAAALSRLNRALRVLALVQGVEQEPQALLSAAQIAVAQQARALLAEALFPLPQDANTQAPPGLLLGAGRLYQFAERVAGYALGTVAEAVNLLAGERQGNRFRHTASLTDRQLEATQSQRASQQHSDAQQQRQVQPQLASRTQFNDLAQQYGQDGLSLTVSGNYLVTPGTCNGGDFQPLQQARSEIQQLLESALSQVQHKVHQQREQLLRATWESSRWQRLDNSAAQPRRGFYHWLLERHDVRLRDLGPHLLFHWTLDDPGQALLACLNSQYGLRWMIPAPPWQTQGEVPGVNSPAELNQDNYLALAQRYGIQALLTAPQENCLVSQDLSATPPQTRGVLGIAPGYESSRLEYAAAPNSSGSLLIAGQALDLAAAQPVDLPGLSGEVPFTLAATRAGLAVSLRLHCRAQHYAVQLGSWQERAYRQLQDAYRQTLSDLATALQRFCAKQPGGFTECLVNLLQGAILNAVQSHYPDSQGLSLRRAQQLQPWLRRALPWQHAVLACASAQQPADWLPLSGELQQPQAGLRLLQAAQLRMTLALDNASAARLFYLLRSGGRLWLGDDTEVPVFAEDAALYNLWQDMRHDPAEQDQCWSFSVETCHRYLADCLNLEPTCSSQ
ncbi:hypothetical protein [Atopomonas hussainii]|uniref:hypothetical protein n=1 Tax=Atopomonas hussainii TaxID=1429083 RepID=UPI0008FFF692|nr:hypothetical protein [Atopomonas hussainii]